MKNTFFYIILILVFSFLFFYENLNAQTIEITKKEGTLSADIQDAPLIKVLEVLSRESGASVFVDRAIQDKKITTRFRNLPVERAVKKLVYPYSCGAVFSQRINKSGEKELYISDIKVYESGKSSGEFVNVNSNSNDFDSSKRPPGRKSRSSDYQSPFRVPPPVPGVHGKNSYAGKAQEAIHNKQVESRIKKITYMRSKNEMEEGRVKKEIMKLKIALTNANEDERKSISSELSDKTRELYNLQKRNRIRLQNEERILRQLQAR